MSYDATYCRSDAILPESIYALAKKQMVSRYRDYRKTLLELHGRVYPEIVARLQLPASDSDWPGHDLMPIISSAINKLEAEGYDIGGQLYDDYQELLFVISKCEKSTLAVGKYWSIAKIDEVMIAERWPEIEDNPVIIGNPGKSYGSWSFDDARFMVNLSINPDWQGDQWGLDNPMMRYFEKLLKSIEWPDPDRTHLGATPCGYTHYRYDTYGCVFYSESKGNLPCPQKDEMEYDMFIRGTEHDEGSTQAA